MTDFWSLQTPKTETTTTIPSGEIDRTVLPILPPEIAPFTMEDAREAKAPAPWDVKATKGASNVILVLIDDFGFGMSSAFGGPIKMPFAEKLAQNGLRYLMRSFIIIFQYGFGCHGDARTIHRAAWETTPRRKLADDIWELFNVNEDFSMSKNLASENPEKLKELKDLFATEAVKYHVFPLEDRSVERLDPAQAGRPDAMGDRTKLTLYEGMGGLQENAFINIKNTSSVFTADVNMM